jgi:hypothetical protein
LRELVPLPCALAGNKEHSLLVGDRTVLPIVQYVPPRIIILFTEERILWKLQSKN